MVPSVAEVDPDPGPVYIQAVSDEMQVLVQRESSRDWFYIQIQFQFSVHSVSD